MPCYDFVFCSSLDNDYFSSLENLFQEKVLPLFGTSASPRECYSHSSIYNQNRFRQNDIMRFYLRE